MQAETNHSARFARSNPAATFIFRIPASISAFSLMYMLPNMPHTTPQNTVKIQSHPKRMEIALYSVRKPMTRYTIAVRPESVPTTTAKAYFKRSVRSIPVDLESQHET